MRSRVCAWALAALVCPAVLAEADFLAAEPLLDAGLVKFWQFQLPLETGQVLRDAYLVDNQLYLGTQDGYAFAVDARTGLLRWLQPVTRSGYHLRRPAHFGENTAFVTPTDIQIYNRYNGDPVMRRELRFPCGTGAVSDGKRLYVGGIDGRLYAFDVERYILDWRIVTDGPIHSLPVLQNNFVYVANDAGTVDSCTRDNKVFHWRAGTYGAVSADIVADENGVYVPCRDQSLYLFDLDYGVVRWRARFTSPLYEAPFLATNVAFQYSATDGLVAVETRTTQDVLERLRWKLPEGRRALAVNEDVVYVQTVDDNLVMIRQKDGAVLYSVPAPGFTIGIPSHEAGTVILANPDGRVFCARPRNAPPLKSEDLIAALRPPGSTTAAATTSEQPTTQPAAAAAPDLLRTKSSGPPMGGKSKVSRGFRKGEPE